jgi:hypothetical protein
MKQQNSYLSLLEAFGYSCGDTGFATIKVTKGILKTNLDIIALKQQLLKLCIEDVHKSAIFYSEDPLADALEGSWSKVGDHQWLIPSGFDSTSLYNWLQLGNWSIYEYRNVAKPLIDPRSSTKAVQKWMQETSCRVLISSYFDNDPWYVFIDPV